MRVYLRYDFQPSATKGDRASLFFLFSLFSSLSFFFHATVALPPSLFFRPFANNIRSRTAVASCNFASSGAISIFVFASAFRDRPMRVSSDSSFSSSIVFFERKADIKDHGALRNSVFWINSHYDVCLIIMSWAFMLFDLLLCFQREGESPNVTGGRHARSKEWDLWSKSFSPSNA